MYIGVSRIFIAEQVIFQPTRISDHKCRYHFSFAHHVRVNKHVNNSNQQITPSAQVNRTDSYNFVERFRYLFEDFACLQTSRLHLRELCRNKLDRNVHSNHISFDFNLNNLRT